METQCKFHAYNHSQIPWGVSGLLICTTVSTLVPAAASLLSCSLQREAAHSSSEGDSNPALRKPQATCQGNFLQYLNAAHGAVGSIYQAR